MAMNIFRLPLLHRLVLSDNNLESLREFLRRGIDPNLDNYSRNTLLHSAATSNSVNIQVVRELIHAGADVNFRNRMGFAPLHLAAAYSKGEMAEALLQAGANINARTPWRITPLHYAINNRGAENPLPPAAQQVVYTPVIELVRMLLQHEDIEVNARDISGETPLVWAIIKNQRQVVKALLARGADPMINSLSGESPLHYAFASHEPCVKTVFLLLRHGASLSTLNRDNQTPIDILVDRTEDAESLRFAKLFLKRLVFQYNISQDVARSIERHSELGFYLLVCSEEVTVMKRHIICKELTVHGFMQCRYNKERFYDDNEEAYEIYKPLVDILLTGLYSAYLRDILSLIPKHNLWDVLMFNLSLRNERENLQIFSHLHFFQMCINSQKKIYESLSHWEIFNLLLSNSNLSDVMINYLSFLDI